MSTKKKYMRQMLLTSMLLFSLLMVLPVSAQPVVEIIKKNPAYASCNYSVYPDSIPDNLTPAPEGKHPFYISHYGRHGSRYISNRKGYDIPYRMMAQAESVDELTPTGKKVLEEMRLILNDTEDRWGELTYLGGEQHRQIARRMMQRFPEVFEGDAHVHARSLSCPVVCRLWAMPCTRWQSPTRICRYTWSPPSAPRAI